MVINIKATSQILVIYRNIYELLAEGYILKGPFTLSESDCWSECWWQWVLGIQWRLCTTRLSGAQQADKKKECNYRKFCQEVWTRHQFSIYGKRKPCFWAIKNLQFLLPLEQVKMYSVNVNWLCMAYCYHGRSWTANGFSHMYVPHD